MLNTALCPSRELPQLPDDIWDDICARVLVWKRGVAATRIQKHVRGAISRCWGKGPQDRALSLAALYVALSRARSPEAAVMLSGRYTNLPYVITTNLPSHGLNNGHVITWPG